MFQMEKIGKKFIIVGGGKFGLKALEYSIRQGYVTILIDSDSNCSAKKYADKKLEEVAQLMYLLTHEPKKNWVYFLNRDVSVLYYLLKEISAEFIVPTVPVHVIAALITQILNTNMIQVVKDENATKRFAESANKDLMLSANPSEAYICLSYAKEGEICPDNCSGPEDLCPTFKRKKSIPITKYLADSFNQSSLFEMKGEDPIKIGVLVQSVQLAPGLGAISGEAVTWIYKKLNDNLELFKTKNWEIAVGTSCNCHGIVNFYKKQ